MLIIIFNGRILPVANAAKPATATSDTKPAIETCPAPWKELEKDAFKCQQEYSAKDPQNTSDEISCTELKSSNPQYTYRRLDSDSLSPKEAADAKTKARITCIKQFKAVPDSADLVKKVEVLISVQAFLNRLIWPILVLTGGLMENDLLFGNGMEEKLRDVWIPIRNLVNILFVIVLVGIALYNVLGLGDDSGNSSIKTMLPKLVIGIIAVNFSFLAIKVVLDGINALTVSIFALPGQVNEGLAEVLKADPDSKMVKKLCAQLEGTPFGTFDQTPDDQLKQEQETAIYRQIGQKDAYKTAGITGSDSIQQIKDKIKKTFDDGSATGKQTVENFNSEIQSRQNGRFCNAKGLTPQGKLFLNKYNSRNAAFAMALNMGKIVFYEDVTFDVKNAEKLFVNTLFSLLLYFIYAASFLALFVVLLGRLVVMWLCIAVSPVLLLMIATPGLKDKFGDFGKLTDQFIKNALAPVLIALSLTIGWIMLKAVQSLNLGQNATTFLSNSALIMDPSNGVPVGGLYTIQDFMVALGVIAVVWMGVFSAAEGTVAQFATDWMKSHLESAGKWVGSLPFKHLPMVPIGLPGHEHKNVTLGSVADYMKRIGSSARKDTELWDWMHGGEKTGAASEMESIHEKDALLQHLKRAGDQLKTKDHQKAMKKWLEDPKNEKTRIEMERNGIDGKALLENMGKIAAGKDKDIDQAVAAIKNNPLVAATDIRTPTKPASGAQTKPKPGTPSVSGVSPDQPIGGKPLKEIVKDEAGQKTISDQKTKIDATLADKTKNNTQKKADVTANLTTIKGTFAKDGHNLNAGELEEMVGAEKYQQIQTAVGGPAELDKILQTPPAAPSGAAHAPTPSTPSAGGPPPPPPAPGP